MERLGFFWISMFLTAVFLIFSNPVFAHDPESTEEGDRSDRISFHGYGELHYNLPKTGSSVPKSTDPNAMDLHRMVWGLSYRFDDRITLHTEVDFEHAATEIELEFAYLDFAIDPAFNVRAGTMLMPVGPLNEFHEPPLFYSVERPYVQAYLIPTTWQEGGAGIHGSPLPGLKYRTYLVSGLDASGFSDSTGIRSGRKKTANAPSEDLAWVARLEYVGIPGLRIGGSYYSGGANAQKLATLDGAGVTLVEGDLRYRIAGFEIQGVYASTTVDEAAKISAVTGKTIGSKQEGWYAEGAWHLLRSLKPDSDRDLVIFVRHEEFNTQKEVVSGAANPANDRRVLTYGIACFPHPDVAVKLDQEHWKDESDQEEERINLGLAYMF